MKIKLIYLDAPFAYFMGYMACLAQNENMPIAALMCILCYLAIHVLTIWKYDVK